MDFTLSDKHPSDLGLMHISVCHIFLEIGKVSLYDFSKYIFCALTWTSFLFSIDIILRFGLFMGFYISWIFCAKSYLDLMFSLTDESVSSIVSSALEILSSMSCILMFMLAFLVLDHFLIISISLIPLFVFPLLSIFWFSSLESFLSSV